MSDQIIVPLQGFFVNCSYWIDQAKLQEIADSVSLPLVPYRKHRGNWPASYMGDGKFWQHIAGSFNDWLDGRQCFLLGHSDGASFAARLAMTLPGSVCGICWYAGTKRSFGRRESEPAGWPPALFMVNSGDRTPAGGDDTPVVYEQWQGQKSLHVFDIGKGDSLIDSHKWKPELANLLCIEFIKDNLK